MYYKIEYSCASHAGYVRRVNQDNYICAGSYRSNDAEKFNLPLRGTQITKDNPVFGVFDGLGGGEYGEVASYIAACEAANISPVENWVEGLSSFCHKVNEKICNYTAIHGATEMGTTAAIIAFSEKDLTVCNIGDSKVLRLRNGILTQISFDHIEIAAFGVKPPLSQYLGIPATELIIEPYLIQSSYKNGDVYLICSDGLTDMVSLDEITTILQAYAVEQAASELLNCALSNGGKDNISLIICKLRRCYCL